MKELWDIISSAGLGPVLVSLPAGAFWLWYVIRLSRYHPLPWWLIILTFVLGALSPAGVHPLTDILHERFPALARAESGSFVSVALYFTIAVGMVEEGCKLLVTLPVVYLFSRVDDTVDGVVLAGAAALGFATLENVLYTSRSGQEVMLGRAILATFGHVLMSSMWGLALGYAKARRLKSGLLLLLCGWLVGSLVHGMYDSFLVAGSFPLAVILLFVTWRILVRAVDTANEGSPHKPRVARRVGTCSHCSTLTRTGARYCSGCGRHVDLQETFCSACVKSVGADDEACAHCGAKLV